MPCPAKYLLTSVRHPCAMNPDRISDNKYQPRRALRHVCGAYGAGDSDVYVSPDDSVVEDFVAAGIQRDTYFAVFNHCLAQGAVIQELE